MRLASPSGPYLPVGLDDFVGRVVPGSPRRGLFQREYEGRTLREDLGLPRPVDRFFPFRPQRNGERKPPAEIANLTRFGRDKGSGRRWGMSPDLATYPGYRFPAEVIGHAVWLCHVLGLGLRDVELILAERGIGVTHESVRQWCLRFGADFARRLRRRRPRPGNTWHLDEVLILSAKS